MVKILIIVCCAIHVYLGANKLNNKFRDITDDYFPRKKWKSDDLFWFDKKEQPIRWLAYWMERIVQIVMFLFVLNLILGNMISGSFDFVTAGFIGFWMLMMYLCPCGFEICIYIYAIIQNRYKSKKKDK